MTAKGDTNIRKVALMALAATMVGSIFLLDSHLANATGQENNLPSTAHFLSIYLKDGRVSSITEAFYDRMHMRCKIEHYLEGEFCDLAESRLENLGQWESLKRDYHPKCIDIYSNNDTYAICWHVQAISDFDVDPCESLSENSESVSSERKLRPVCVISKLPHVPVAGVFEWDAFFSREALNANELPQGLPEEPIPDERTGEYVFAKGLYEEHFRGKLPNPTPVTPDYLLSKTWYESKYHLPIRELLYGVRQDNYRYLYAIFLYEYDLPLPNEIFDPDFICGGREGFAVLKQTIPGG